MTYTANSSKPYPPGDCFPANSEANHKNSYAMAFINCQYNVFLTIESIIKYLNDNISVIKDNDDNW